jgi:nitronate monooxygenase
MRTALTDLLNIEYPVLSAPMGNVSGGELSAAVSEAGGLGLVGAGYGSADWLKRELGKCRDARIGVGFITWGLAKRPDLLDLVLEHAPAAIMFSFGDYKPFLPTVRRGGAKVICQVQNVRSCIVNRACMTVRR